MAKRDYEFIAVDFEGDAGDRGLTSMSWFGENHSGWTTNHDHMRTTLTTFGLQGFDFACHNAEYDIAVGFWQLGLPVEVDTYSNRFHHGQWQVSKRGRKTRIWDTVRLSGGLPLAKIGPIYDLPKLPTPRSLIYPDAIGMDWQCDRHGKWECVECYAVRDAEITYAYIKDYIAFCRGYNIDPRHTLTSTAVQIWKVTDAPLNIEVLSKRVESLARAAYRGGRTELFKPGHHNNIYEADVNSMYPYVMLTQPFPDMEELKYAEHDACSTTHFQSPGVSECTVHVPDRYIPVLGVVSQGYAYYPVGSLRGAWTHAEINAAMERGAVVTEIYRQCWSDSVVQPFSTFITALSQQKNDYDKVGDPRRLVAKLIMNCLYGHLGLRGDNTRGRYRPVWKTDTPESLEGWEVADAGTTVYVKKEYQLTKRSPYANVLWAAHVTAYARLELLRHIESAGDDIVYCDTDSVFSLRSVGTLSNELGDFNSKGMHRSGYFSAPKLYSLTSESGDTSYKAKGVPKSVAKEYIETGQASFSRPRRLIEAARRGGGAGVWIDVTKRRMLVPARRIPTDVAYTLGGDGWSDTRPSAMELADCELPTPDWEG